jgi:hypothetical protein
MKKLTQGDEVTFMTTFSPGSGEAALVSGTVIAEKEINNQPAVLVLSKGRIYACCYINSTQEGSYLHAFMALSIQENLDKLEKAYGIRTSMLPPDNGMVRAVDRFDGRVAQDYIQNFQAWQ